MCSKVFFMLALLATTSIQLGHSLKCLTCFDYESCKTPQQVECNATTSNLTRNVLELFYNDVRYLNSNDFSCFSSSYGLKNITTIDLRGCIMTGTVDCFSYFADQTKEKKSCNVCKKDLCNSVGAISASLATTLVLYGLAKMFVI